MTKEEAIERLEKMRHALPNVLSHEEMAKAGTSYSVRREVEETRQNAEALDVAIEELHRMIGLEK